MQKTSVKLAKNVCSPIFTVESLSLISVYTKGDKLKFARRNKLPQISTLDNSSH